ncbi:metallophosphoesterase [Halobacteriovorax sp. GB3]|uniref:metallophosphoesterase n=1 Tax=Halobacteriovorax sp. GB3 TaxID=2719615 RepID=UPI002362C323|nr:metallophosphoesterase [Halobacteriovorax sp. GB3]MDD0851914.1 metallophosphoesterase [Halobacteriovorax sp. GB3]
MDFIFGDIHGCYDELVALIEKCTEHHKKHAPEETLRFISCGDLIDRGPKSKEVIDLFIENENFFAIAGNHEQEFVSLAKVFAKDSFSKNTKLPVWVHDLEKQYEEHKHEMQESFVDYTEGKLSNWIVQGGKEFIQSFELEPLKPDTWTFDKKYIDFFLNLDLIFEGDNYILTHALILNEQQESLEQNKIETIEQADHFLWNRRAKNIYTHPDKLMISGHTPFFEGAKWRKNKKVLQLDTGCCYGEKLTAWCNDGTLLEQEKV